VGAAGTLALQRLLARRAAAGGRRFTIFGG